MNISEAVREALDKGGFITTPEFRGRAKIKPTDGPGNCIVSMWDGSKPSRYGWQPSAKDLIRDDWEVENTDCPHCAECREKDFNFCNRCGKRLKAVIDLDWKYQRSSPSPDK